MDPAVFIGIGILLIFVVFAIHLITAYGSKETQRYPDLKEKVIFFSHECGDITWTVKKQPYRISLKPKEAIKNKSLQQKAKDRVAECPINTKLRITNYVWDLVEVLTSCDLLPPNWIPMGAYCFCNGVVMVRYKEKPPEKGEANPAIKDLYFSTADGHLIYFKK